MKTKQCSLGIIALAIAFTGIFSSCKKKKEEKVKDSDTSTVMIQEHISDMVNQMIRIADEAGRPQSNRQNDVSSQARLIYDTLSAAKTMTVDFNYNVYSRAFDGLSRSGALIISFYGNYRDSLTKVTIRSRYYEANGKNIMGSLTITNKGHNASGHLVYDIDVDMIISLLPNYSSLTVKSKGQREWISGENTQSRQDDVYAYTGTSSGKSEISGDYHTEIISPLIRKIAPGCLNATSGSVAFTPIGKEIRYINYGNGDCDNLAIITIDNELYIVSLP